MSIRQGAAPPRLSAPSHRLVAGLLRPGAHWLVSPTERAPYSNFGHAKAALDVELAAGRARAAGLGRPTAGKLAGHALPARRLHDLRRSVATGLQRLGARLEALEAVLGHLAGSRAGVVGVHQRHRFEDEPRDALERWGAHVERLAGDSGGGPGGCRASPE